jgi:hypothetical protein
MDHYNSGVFTEGVNETYDEEAYLDAKKQIFDLIEELNKSDIPADQKLRIINDFKSLSENSTTLIILIKLFKGIFGN